MIKVYTLDKFSQPPLGTNIVVIPCKLVSMAINGGEYKTELSDTLRHGRFGSDHVISAVPKPNETQYLYSLNCLQKGPMTPAGEILAQHTMRLMLPRGTLGEHKEGHVEILRSPNRNTTGLARSVITGKEREFPMPRAYGGLERLITESLLAIYCNPPKWLKIKRKRVPACLTDIVDACINEGWPTPITGSKWPVNSLAGMIAQHLLGIYTSQLITIEDLTAAGLLHGSIPLIGPLPSSKIYDTIRNVRFVGIFVKGPGHAKHNLQLCNAIKQLGGLDVKPAELQEALMEAARTTTESLPIATWVNDESAYLYAIGLNTTKPKPERGRR